jgi:hypothetical protein
MNDINELTSLNFTTWTLTVFTVVLFSGIALFADGASVPRPRFFALLQAETGLNRAAPGSGIQGLL